MKIRTGFVSNSSSSSFCIIGAMITDKSHHEINEKLDKFNCTEKDRHNQLEYTYGIEDYSSDAMFIGLTFDNMQENETKEQFKKRIFELLEKALGDDFKEYTIEDIQCYVDGGYCG